MTLPTKLQLLPVTSLQTCSYNFLNRIESPLKLSSHENVYNII